MTLITTPDELQAVARGTIVHSSAGTIACRFDETHGVVFGDDRPIQWSDLALPAEILWPNGASQAAGAYETQEDWAADVQAAAIKGSAPPHWSHTDYFPDQHEVQYAIEPDRGSSARCHTDELCTAIEELPDYRNTARIIMRHITYGPWRYVTPEEVKGE